MACKKTCQKPWPSSSPTGQRWPVLSDFLCSVATCTATHLILRALHGTLDCVRKTLLIKIPETIVMYIPTCLKSKPFLESNTRFHWRFYPSIQTRTIQKNVFPTDENILKQTPKVRWPCRRSSTQAETLEEQPNIPEFGSWQQIISKTLLQNLKHFSSIWITISEEQSAPRTMKAAAEVGPECSLMWLQVTQRLK